MRNTTRMSLRNVSIEMVSEKAQYITAMNILTERLIPQYQMILSEMEAMFDG